MEQFNLEKWLQDKSQKIVTRDRRPVRIVCWDVKGLFPVLGLIVGNGERDTKVGEEYPCCYKVDGTCPVSDSYDLFFADEKKTNKILDELKSYLKNTPKEQVEKDWKEIQDWYVQHFTNEKHDEEEKLTEFKPKFTYNENDYSKLANKLIEFRNNTPLCSVSYRDGDGRNVILHYEKEIFELVKNEIFQDLPKWKDSWSTSDNTKPQIIGDCLVVGDNLIHISDLVNKLPKEK